MADQSMYIENLFEKTSDPMLTLLVTATVAAIAGYCVQWIGRKILLRLTRRFSAAEKLVLSTAGPMQLVMPLLFLQFVWLATPDSWDFMPRIKHMTGLVFIAAMTWLIIRGIGGIADTVLALRPLTATDNLHARSVQTQTRVIARALMFVVGLIQIPLLQLIVMGVFSIVAYPIVAITAAVLYYDTRIKSEGLDIELMAGALDGAPPREATAP